MDTSQKLLSSPRELGAIYRDEGKEPVRREQALADLLEIYKDAVAHPARAKEAGDVLAECLAPAVRRMARRVAQGASPGDKADFVDEAMSLVLAPRVGLPPPICKYIPGQPLESWLHTALHNLWVSDRRKWRCRQRALEKFAQTRRASLAFTWDWPDHAEMLSVADLERIAGWDCRHRVELLCLTDLWRLVPGPYWEDWLAAYEHGRRITLGRPFPPEDVLLCEGRAERLRPLARCFGYSPNTLTQHWLRWQPCLRELAFVRELGPTWPGQPRRRSLGC